MVALAIVHVVSPKLAIDGVFLGLIAFAAILLLFDVESLEWQGMKLRRKSKVASALLADTVVPGEPIPTLAPPATEPVGVEMTEHRRAEELLPPPDPVEKIVWAAEQIRVELIILAGNAGHLPPNQTWAAYHAIPLAEDLAGRLIIPRSIVEPIRAAVDNRNAVIHSGLGIRVLGQEAVSLGLDTLTVLRQVRRNYHRVSACPVRLYADQTLTTSLPVAGVLIEQFDDEGNGVSANVYPAGREYSPGRFVTWHWDMERVVRQEGWYEHPKTKRATHAFSEAAHFVGMEYPEQWGVQYRF
jgi:hypothetical protein